MKKLRMIHRFAPAHYLTMVSDSSRNNQVRLTLLRRMTVRNVERQKSQVKLKLQKKPSKLLKLSVTMSEKYRLNVRH
jgi:hypothetical protein